MVPASHIPRDTPPAPTVSSLLSADSDAKETDTSAIVHAFISCMLWSSSSLKLSPRVALVCGLDQCF